MAIIIATAAVTVVAFVIAGIGWFQYMKVCQGSDAMRCYLRLFRSCNQPHHLQLKVRTANRAEQGANNPNMINGLGDLPTAEVSWSGTKWTMG